MDLTGDALINQSGDCSGSGYYAILSETTEGGDAFTGAKSIVIANSDIEQVMIRKGYRFFKGVYNLNIIGVRSKESIKQENRFDQ